MSILSVVLFLLISVLVSTPFLSISDALLSTSINSHDIRRIVNEFTPSIEDGDAAAIHSYLTIHSLLHPSGELTDKKSLVSLIQSSLSSSSDLSILHDTISSLTLLKLKPTINDKQRNALITALGSTNLLVLYPAVSTLVLLHQANIVNMKDYDLAKILTTLNELEELDHTHRLSFKADDGNIYATALVYDLLAQLSSVSPIFTTAVQTALTHADDIIKAGIKTHTLDLSYGLPPHVTQLQAVGQLVHSIVLLMKAVHHVEAFGLSAKEIEIVANYLLSNKYVNDPDELTALIQGLTALNTLTPPLTPISLIVTNASSSSVQVKVTDILDKPISHKIDVVASFISTASKDSKNSHKELTFSAISSLPGVYEEKQKWSTLPAGHYNATFTVHGSSLSLPLTKTSPIKSLAASVYLSDSNKEKVDDKIDTITYPAVIPLVLTAEANKWLIVKITLENELLAPEQIAIILQRTSSSNPIYDSNLTTSTVFPTKKVTTASSDGGNANTHVYVGRISFLGLDVNSAIGGGGAFIIHVLIGDALIDPVDWPLANLELNSPRVISQQIYGTIKPIIYHTFRTADIRPPYILSFLFTLLIIIPLLILLYSLTDIRLSLPTNPIELSSSFIFQLTLVAMMVLYFFYWWKLNIFQALTGIIILSVIALLSGNKSLTALHIRKARGGTEGTKHKVA